MKYQASFSAKPNEKLFMNVVCGSRDWRFDGYTVFFSSSLDGSEISKSFSLNFAYKWAFSF